MSSYRNIDEPIFFTPPTNQPDGRRTLYKGGGGGGGAREATAEEKRLWALQGDSLESLNQISMPMLQTGMNNLGNMANESMDGTMAARLRDTAGADVSSSFANQRDQQGRQMASMGINPNNGAWANNDAKMRMAEAAGHVGAKSMANMAAEDVKWQRNAALTGIASGQGAQSVSGMGSLAAQIGQNRANSNAMDMQAQQSQGNTMAGLMVGGKMMGMYKDGGAVVNAVKGGIRFASGGQMQSFKPSSMPKFAPYAFSDSSKPQADGGMLETAANVAVPAMGIDMMATGLDKVGIAAPKQAIDGFMTAGKNTVAKAMVPTQSAAPIVEGVLGASTPAATGMAAMAPETAVMAAEYVAPTIAAGAAPAVAAAPVAGSSLMAAAGTAMPWLAAGYAVGSMLDLWADGGDVRKDMTTGGKVSGPGTGTSDSVKALLSDGEIVANTAAVGLGKSETQKVIQEWQGTGKGARDLLLAINDKGLEKRYGKDKAKANPRYEGGAQKMALGGIASALGNGLFKAAPMMNQIDEQRKTDGYRQAQMGIMQNQDKRAADAAAQTTAMHDIQIGQANQAVADDKAMRGYMTKAMQDLEKMKGGDLSPIMDMSGEYNQNSGAFNDGNKVRFTSSVPGGGLGGVMVGADGKETAFEMDNNQLADKYMQGVAMKMGFTNPQQFASYMKSRAEERDRQHRIYREGVEDKKWDTTRNDNRENSNRSYGLQQAQLGISQSANDRANQEFNYKKADYAEEKANAQKTKAATAAWYQANQSGDEAKKQGAMLELINSGALDASNLMEGDGVTTKIEADPVNGGLVAFQVSKSGETRITPINTEGGAMTIPAPGAKAGGAQPKPKPKVGEVIGGFKFKGGDVNAKESWEPINQPTATSKTPQPSTAQTMAAQGVQLKPYRDLSENAVNRNAVKLIASDVGDVLSGNLRKRRQEEEQKRREAVYKIAGVS